MELDPRFVLSADALSHLYSKSSTADKLVPLSMLGTLQTGVPPVSINHQGDWARISRLIRTPTIMVARSVPPGSEMKYFGSIAGYSVGSAKRSMISPRLFGRWSTQLAFKPDRLLHRAKNNTTSPSYSFQALPIDRRPPRGNHSYTNEGRPRPLGTEPMRILTTRGCDRPISRGVLPSSAVGGIVPGRQGTASPSIAFASGRELR